MAVDWFTTCALVVLAAWLLWKYLSWNHNYWERLGVPCVEPSVPFGNFKDLFLGKTSSTESFLEIYRKMDGVPFCGVYRFREAALLVRDAELVRQMLVRDFPSFQDNNIFVDEKLDPAFARNPFFLKGERWRKVRSQLSPSFTASRLKPMFLLIKDVCDNMVRMLKEEEPKASTDGLEAWRLCMRYTADVVSSCALGVRGRALEDENSPLQKMFRKLLEPTFMTILTLFVMATSPKLATLLRLRLMSVEVHKFVHKLVTDTIAQRESGNVQRRDYLQLLVDLKNKGYLDSAGQVLADKSSFTDIDIVAQVMTFMTDGTHTSATTMSFALYELALHEDIQQHLREELREAVDKHGGRLGYDAINDCTYLDMVFSEALRLHPPVGHLEKTCTAAYPMTTPSGRTFTLQPGTTVMVSIAGLHGDPRYFPEPDVFDPERFSPDKKDRNAMQAYIPFGLGARSCIGLRFAHSQVKMGVATLVLNFKITTTPRTPVPLQLDPRGFLRTAKGGLWLRFQPLAH
ncbi:probable cytochrome P450 6a20 [Schistocerca serialis cubense]|uniref:probable cytochrome P450 6a20 n=1 Tax=Schistocerca serialis cubense TaxID=2023355 RepID=UPI00214F5513|nr:probable cytochrome P450 6a20 [Schistocerca serialis cubense]